MSSYLEEMEKQAKWRRICTIVIAVGIGVCVIGMFVLYFVMRWKYFQTH